jgi:hypothetical protein
MGDLNKALEFLSKGLEIDKKHLKKKNWKLLLTICSIIQNIFFHFTIIL